jgi:hypothetical protein
MNWMMEGRLRMDRRVEELCRPKEAPRLENSRAMI